MNTQHQRQYVLDLLREAGSRGVNSYDLTYKYSIKQAPTRVHELRKEGHLITTRRRRNQSVDYIYMGKSELMDTQKEASVTPSETPKPAWEYEYYAYQKEGRTYKREVTPDIEPLLKSCPEHIRYLGESCFYCAMRMEASV